MIEVLVLLGYSGSRIGTEAAASVMVGCTAVIGALALLLWLGALKILIDVGI